MDEAESAKRWLARAVHEAGTLGAVLWINSVGERARVGEIAKHLRTHVSSEWDVDEEYNRDGAAAKRLRVDPLRPPALSTPDLIVHKRGASGSGNNLLFIEFKLTYKNQGIESVDCQKAMAAVSDLGYLVGGVIGLGPRARDFAPVVRWFESGRSGTTEPLSDYC